MWAFTQQLELIRYLFVLRVQRSLVWAPRPLVPEFSVVLGTQIAERLPAREAHPWRKALAAWEPALANWRKNNVFPEAPWPIQAVHFLHPTKRSFTAGEPLLWELKLMGESADHGFFLEVILPAVEAAGNTQDARWKDLSDLWGGFNIQSLYVAQGNRWTPLAEDGRLDLSRQVTPYQWAEELPLHPPGMAVRDRLRWVTPFDFSNPSRRQTRPTKRPSRQETPTLPGLLDALMARVVELLPGRRRTVAELWTELGAEEQERFEEARHAAQRIKPVKKKLQRAAPGQPGRWIGEQKFQFIPPSMIPYLQLASIFHVGQGVHFGCGTFVLR
ncbi:MAG: hypothetical protein D6790_16805 [Caldilineae bacterium]|nr:MAG: hypothetical protein D6790_16805 [Caldilineae bacterium]